jgi:hypothetical protein
MHPLRRTATAQTLLLRLLLLLLPLLPAVAPAAVSTSISRSSTASAKLSSCYGVAAGQALSLNDFAGSVVVISNYYMGCSPGRLDAPTYGSIASSLTRDFPGQIRFLTALRGSGSCQAWGSTYFGSSGGATSVSVLHDSNSVLVRHKQPTSFCAPSILPYGLCTLHACFRSSMGCSQPTRSTWSSIRPACYVNALEARTSGACPCLSAGNSLAPTD